MISETFGLRFDFAREDELTLPAASTPELRVRRARRAPTAGRSRHRPHAGRLTP